MRTEIKANGNTIQATTASAPRPSGMLPHTVGYVATLRDSTTLGKPTMWSLARLIRRYCLHIGAAISARAMEFHCKGSKYEDQSSNILFMVSNLLVKAKKSKRRPVLLV
jgi:hypothetical protein